MSSPKRKYNKHKTESKISVRHYLNKKVTNVTANGEFGYSLYVQIIHKGKTNYFKSILNLSSTEAGFEEFKENYKIELDSERLFITEKIKQISQNSPEGGFSLKNIAGDSREMIWLIDSLIKKELVLIENEIQIELEKLIKSAVDISEYEKVIKDRAALIEAIDFNERNAVTLIKAYAVIFNNDFRVIKLKDDFVRQPDFAELMFNKSGIAGINKVNDTLKMWKAGLTQSNVLYSVSGDKYKTELCHHYIKNIDSLLLRHDL